MRHERSGVYSVLSFLHWSPRGERATAGWRVSCIYNNRNFCHAIPSIGNWSFSLQPRNTARDKLLLPCSETVPELLIILLAARLECYKPVWLLPLHNHYSPRGSREAHTSGCLSHATTMQYNGLSFMVRREDPEDADRAPLNILITTILLVITTIFVILRITARRMKKVWGPEDWYCIAALVR